jgi:hypothetical protein
MRRSFRLFSRLVLLLVPAILLIAQSGRPDAFTGTWKLNLAKSKFSSGAGPQSATITVTPDGTFTMEEVNEKGKPMKWSHASSVDKEVPIDGIENGTMISKVQGSTLNETMKVAGKTVQTVHAVLSPDGKTIRATIDGTDNQGRHRHSVEVYDKQ